MITCTMASQNVCIGILFRDRDTKMNFRWIETII